MVTWKIIQVSVHIPKSEILAQSAEYMNKVIIYCFMGGSGTSNLIIK